MAHHLSANELIPLESNQNTDESILPAEFNDTIDVPKLWCLLASSGTKQFIKEFREYEKHDIQNVDLIIDYKKISGLLSICMHCDAHRVFDAVLNSQYNVGNFDGTELITNAVISNKYIALRKILSHSNIEYHDSNMMSDFIRSGCTEESLKILKETRSDIDVNACHGDGLTPLTTAVICRNWECVRFLLRNGAYLHSSMNRINLKSVDGTYRNILTEIPTDLLAEHFDDCIEKINDSGRISYVEMKYHSLILKRNNTVMDSDKDQQLESSLPLQSTQVDDQMAVIANLATSKEHRRLLLHPLIQSFMFLKWLFVSRIFNINFISYSIFAISIIGFILFKYHDANTYHVAMEIFRALASIGIAYVMLRELIQIIMLPRTYFCSPINMMEIALIILSVMALVEPAICKGSERIVDAFTILLVGFELCVLMGSLPAISTHMQMLREVCKTFLRCSVLYLAFIITFSLCFYVLFGGKSVNTTNSDAAGTTNRFSNPILAFMWTIVMLTGDFDTGNIRFDNPSSYVIFILFVVFMAIVLINLLNGLAVSDTQAIKNEAEVYASISLCNIISQYDNFLNNRPKALKIIWNHRFIRTICNFPSENPYPQIIIDDNEMIMSTDEKYLKSADQKCIKMPHRIVKSALDVIDKKDTAKIDKRPEETRNKLKKEFRDMTWTLHDGMIEENGGIATEQRLKKMENKLKNIDKKLNKLLQLRRNF